MNIQFVRRKEIDSNQWDAAIMRSQVPLVYALSSYLDALCDGHWSALIYGDYEAVFPLPMKTKWSIEYIVQPVFCQQLGAFGSSQSVRTKDFIAAIPNRFLRVRLQLNPYFDGEASIALPSKTNYILSLAEPPNYNKDCRKNLSHLRTLPIVYTINTQSFDEVVAVYRNAWGEKNVQLSDRDYQRFIAGCRQLQTRYDAAKTLTATNSETGEVLGAAIFLGFAEFGQAQQKHIHYVCAGPTEPGKLLGIMHGIIDQAIQQHLGGPTFFDFEGSSIPSVAAFYQKFGPTNTPFYLFRRGI